MSLEIISLELVANTSDGRYGVSIPFSNGLFLLRVENSHGKSTCMNGIAYALGMEKALGVGSGKIPFPPSLTRALTTKDNVEVSVISSYVLLKIKNHKGIEVSLKRNIIGHDNNNVIYIDEKNNVKSKSGTYFLHREGDTERERGFYKWLADFIGWSLPNVPNHNGKDTILYPSVLFPAWYVEQKKGWSSIMATVPTQFGIKEPKKRALEFLMSLDVNDNILLRSSLRNELDIIYHDWKLIKHNAEVIASKLSSVVTGIPEQPVAKFDHYKIDLIIKNGSVVRSIVDVRNELEKELQEIKFDTLGEQEEQTLQLSVVKLLGQKNDEINSLELKIKEICEHRSYIQYQIQATKNRLYNLLEDKRKYEDLKKISSSDAYKSTDLMSNICPTCGASYNDNLLSFSSQENLMTYEDSLNFIKEQVKAFEFVLSDSEKQLKLKDVERSDLEGEIAKIRVDINALRESKYPSMVVQEEFLRRKINIENKINAINDGIKSILDIRLELDSLHRRYKKLIAKRKGLPDNFLSRNDADKLKFLNKEVVARLEKYNFTSFDSKLVSISEDNYLPTREGYDIGFDTSASDGIRIIWGYLISLFVVGSKFQTNHPGLIVFDEPRQQEANKVSFAELLKDAAETTKGQGQIIFATSEDENVLKEALEGYDYTMISFDKNNGKLLRKL
ncbi:TPA: hypothetical protein J1Z65_004685 [Escherichia coli]|nr:hypothetical protein [Escherichia coli]